MNFVRIYFDFIEGLFYFFTLEFFTPLNNNDYNISKKHSLRYIYLIYTLLYAIPESFFYNLFLYYSATFLYIFIMSNYKFKSSLLQFFQFEAYATISTITFTFLHSVLIHDFNFLDIQLYAKYKSLICAVLVYVVLCLYTYGKRLAALRNKKRYGIHFCIAIALAVFILSYLSLAMITGQFSGSKALPVIFSIIFIMISISLTSYNNTILSFEENARQEVLISKYELETAYYQNIKNSMDSLRSLRHDFKNHLIVLNGYAMQNEIGKLQEYLQKISDTVTETAIIQTPHDLTSSILNAKSILCRQKHIDFLCHCLFSDIHIPDFHLITILGNVLDNAITAAGKLKNGSISLSMEQTDTFLQIICKNNHQEHIVKKNGQFVSTKENPGLFHGLGIQNIQNSVDALNGTLDIDYNDSFFTVSILLPNYK